MRYVLPILAMASTAHASEAIECSKDVRHGDIVCKTKEPVHIVGVTINGGECEAPAINIYIPKGHKWIVPGTHACYFTRMVTLTFIDGKIKREGPF